MAYDTARQVTVLFGGAEAGAAGAPLDETWEWDGSDWFEGPNSPCSNYVCSGLHAGLVRRAMVSLDLESPRLRHRLTSLP